MPDPSGLSIHEAASLLGGGKISSEELTRSVFSRIKKHEPKIHAYLALTEAGALAQARESDQRRASGKTRGPLDGIPLGIKDNMCTLGTETTCASKILKGWIPPYDATVVRKLREAGAVFTGKLNLDEFAMGSSTENSAFGVTHNPWDLSRVPGGSSGGSAAAVSADLCLGALGSDTGGSIRQPAALCGVVGLKPTYGRVSRYGLVAFASSLDQIGPLAKDVEDAAIILEAIEGFDEKDSTSVKQPGNPVRPALGRGVKGMKFGVAKEWLAEGLDPEVRASFDTARQTLEKLGASFVEVSMPRQEFGLPVYYLIAPAEASSNLARYDGVRYGLRETGANIIEMYKKTRNAGFGPEVKRRIILGTFVLSAGYYDAYYLSALKARTILRKDYETALAQCDFLLSPATPTPAFKIGEKSGDPLQMYLSDIYTVSVNLAGLPGMVLPGGFSKGGLPIGIQLIGPAFREDVLFQAASALEKELGLAGKKPPLEGAGA